MDFGMYVDDKEGLEITVKGEGCEVFEDGVFEGGKEANLPHEHIRLMRDVTEVSKGESIGSGEIKLKPATSYLIKNMEQLEFVR